jgi:hypothetical protein
MFFATHSVHQARYFAFCAASLRQRMHVSMRQKFPNFKEPPFAQNPHMNTEMMPRFSVCAALFQALQKGAQAPWK